jgi:hypothetical protein
MTTDSDDPYSFKGTVRGAEWIKFNEKWREGQRWLFAMNAQGLSTAFAECMALIAEPLKMVEEEIFKGKQQRRIFLGILGLAYQLLQSSWIDNEEGRTAAAAHLWRSIYEIPDYLIAVWWNTEFASTWDDEEVQERAKAGQAMTIVRDKLNSMKEGLGDERYGRRSTDRKELQVMSHVSVQVAGMSFVKAPGAERAHFVPEGYNGNENRQNALYLVGLAKEVLAALQLTIRSEMPEAWQAAFDDTGKALEDMFRRINTSAQRSTENHETSTRTTDAI